MMFFQNKKKATTSQPIKRSSSRCSSIQSTAEISKTDGRRNAIYGTSRSQSRMSIDSTDSLDSLMPVYPPSDCSSIRSCSRSSTSDKSVRFSDTEDELHPGQYSSGSPRSSPRPVLKSKAASMSLLSFQHDPIPAAPEAIDTIIHGLVAAVKAFKCPTKLDFSGCPENPLLLANNETNKPFLNQLRKLNQLRMELAEIQTYDDVLLESKHSAASQAIRFTASARPDLAIKNVVLSLEDCVDELEYPSELDFSTSTEDEMNLVQNVKNRQFIDQLHQLDSLREDLNAISMQGNEQLEKEHKKASMAVGHYLQSLKQHQRTLYDNYVKSYKPRNYIEELVPSPTAEDFEVPVLEKCISARRNKDGTYMSMEFAGFEQVN